MGHGAPQRSIVICPISGDAHMVQGRQQQLGPWGLGEYLARGALAARLAPSTSPHAAATPARAASSPRRVVCSSRHRLAHGRYCAGPLSRPASAAKPNRSTVAPASPITLSMRPRHPLHPLRLRPLQSPRPTATHRRCHRLENRLCHRRLLPPSTRSAPSKGARLGSPRRHGCARELVRPSTLYLAAATAHCPPCDSTDSDPLNAVLLQLHRARSCSFSATAHDSSG